MQKKVDKPKADPKMRKRKDRRKDNKDKKEPLGEAATSSRWFRNPNLCVDGGSDDDSVDEDWE
jgi:hypothetical protein